MFFLVSSPWAKCPYKCWGWFHQTTCRGMGEPMGFICLNLRCPRVNCWHHQLFQGNWMLCSCCSPGLKNRVFQMTPEIYSLSAKSGLWMVLRETYAFLAQKTGRKTSVVYLICNGHYLISAQHRSCEEITPGLLKIVAVAKIITLWNKLHCQFTPYLWQTSNLHS